MDAGTARAQLVRSILFEFLVDGKHHCFRCGEPMTEDDFSVDHKISWLDSDTPRELFFDLANIAYSHKGCNSRASRGNRKYATQDEVRIATNENRRKSRAKITDRRRVLRREQYLRTGK